MDIDAIDARVWYWTAAWLNMLAIVLLARAGIREVRRREIARHRQRMLSAIGLVLAFLLSYPVTLLLLGRAQLGTWGAGYVATLRFHELCVAAMVIGALTALWLATRLRLIEAANGSRGRYAPERIESRLRLHLRAGRTAYWGALLGLVSAGVVLFGMFTR